MSNTSFIISAEKGNQSDSTNQRNTLILLDMLEAAGLNVEVVVGMYKGTRERSVLVKPSAYSAEETRSLLLTAAKNFQQESLLEFNNTGHAWLINPFTREEEFIGRLTLGDKVPQGTDSFTRLNSGQFLYAIDKD